MLIYKVNQHYYNLEYLKENNKGGIVLIEIIYKDETENVSEDTNIKLPKNIKQIGDGNSDYQIYVEDNIMNYLKKSPEKENDIRYGVLLGSVKKSYGYTYIFVNAAIDVEDIVENTVIFSDEIWTNINDNIHRYFGDLKVVGWFTSLNYSVNNDMPYITRIHLDNFAGNDKLYLKLDRIEDEESFYIYGTNGLKKQSGYHIYYEKNNNMEDYIYGSNITSRFRKDSQKKKTTKTDTVNVSKPKYGIEENVANMPNSSAYKSKTTSFEPVAKKLSKNIASILMVLLLVGTIALVSNDEAMKTVRNKLQGLITGDDDSENNIPVNGIINETEETTANIKEDETTSKEEETTKNQENENNPTTGSVTVIENVTTGNTENPTVSENNTTEPTASVVANETNYYTVNVGDTLYSIAMKIYNDGDKVNDIMSLNNIENPDYVEVGDKLLLP